MNMSEQVNSTDEKMAEPSTEQDSRTEPENIQQLPSEEAEAEDATKVEVATEKVVAPPSIEDAEANGKTVVPEASAMETTTDVDQERKTDPPEGSEAMETDKETKNHTPEEGKAMEEEERNTEDSSMVIAMPIKEKSQEGETPKAASPAEEEMANSGSEERLSDMEAADAQSKATSEAATKSTDKPTGSEQKPQDEEMAEGTTTDEVGPTNTEEAKAETNTATKSEDKSSVEEEEMAETTTTNSGSEDVPTNKEPDAQQHPTGEEVAASKDVVAEVEEKLSLDEELPDAVPANSGPEEGPTSIEEEMNVREESTSIKVTSEEDRETTDEEIADKAATGEKAEQEEKGEEIHEEIADKAATRENPEQEEKGGKNHGEIADKAATGENPEQEEKWEKNHGEIADKAATGENLEQEEKGDLAIEEKPTATESDESATTTDDESSSDENYDEPQEDGAKSNDEEGGSDSEKKFAPPLHKLMVDYKQREEQRLEENRKNARKSPRPKRAPDNFVPGPASIFLDPEKQAMKRKLKRELKKQRKLNKKKAKALATNAPENSAKEVALETQPRKSKAHQMESPQPFTPEMVSSGPAVAAEATAPNEIPSSNPLPDGTSSAKPTTTNVSTQETPPKAMKANSMEQRSIKIERLCKGHKFPVQLMLLLKSKIARGCLFWSIEGNGNTFILDCAWFRDDVMKRFFPGNQFQRITLALKRWGFQRKPIDLPDGMMAFCHPLFQRERPELASEMKLSSEMPHSAEKKKKNSERPDHYGGMRVNATAKKAKDFASASKKRMSDYGKKTGGNMAVLQRQEFVANQHHRYAEQIVPPSVRIAALRDGTPPVPPAQATMASYNQLRSHRQEKPAPSASARRHSSAPNVVDLTEDDDQPSAGSWPNPRDFLGYNAKPPQRSSFFSAGQKRKLSSVSGSSSSQSQRMRGFTPFVMSPQGEAIYKDKSYYTEAMRMTARHRKQSAEQKYAYAADEQDRKLRQQHSLEVERAMTMSMRKMARKEAQERAVRMHKVAIQHSLDTERALRVQEEALEQERVRERLALSRERTAARAQQEKKQAKVVVEQDEELEELERRRRLADALFGRSEKKQKTEPTKNVPKEPPSAEREQPPPGRETAPSAAGRRDPASRPADLIDSLRNSATGPSLLASTVGMDPYMALMQQEQQQATLNGLFIPAYAASLPVPPPQAGTIDPVEQWFMLRGFKH